MREERRGEKLGWIGGWVGSFLWPGGFAAIWVVRGRTGVALAAGGLFAIALALTLALAPWRFAATPFWKLALPLYAIFFAAVPLAIAAEGGPAAHGLRPWSLMVLLPVLMPLFTLGRRRWRDGGG